MKKISISINMLDLQGACRAIIKGEDCVVIRLEKCRAKLHTNGKVYLSLDVIENKDGANQWGKTHFVCEPVTKEERQAGTKLPIIGNGKEWGDLAEVKKKAQEPARHPPPPREFDEAPVTPMEDDDIPF